MKKGQIFFINMFKWTDSKIIKLTSLLNNYPNGESRKYKSRLILNQKTP